MLKKWYVDSSTVTQFWQIGLRYLQSFWWHVRQPNKLPYYLPIRVKLSRRLHTSFYLLSVPLHPFFSPVLQVFWHQSLCYYSVVESCSVSFSVAFLQPTPPVRPCIPRKAWNLVWHPQRFGTKAVWILCLKMTLYHRSADPHPLLGFQLRRTLSTLSGLSGLPYLQS